MKGEQKRGWRASQRLDALRGTAYGALQAVTAYATPAAPARATRTRSAGDLRYKRTAAPSAG